MIGTQLIHTAALSMSLVECWILEHISTNIESAHSDIASENILMQIHCFISLVKIIHTVLLITPYRGINCL